MPCNAMWNAVKYISGLSSKSLTHYLNALRNEFYPPFFHCLTIKCCSSLGKNLFTSTHIGEINFAVIIAILGLVFFALLIGNMQVRVAGRGLSAGPRKSSLE